MMDDELAKIAGAGAGALGAAMAADIWRKLHDGMARMLRWIFRRRLAADSAATIAAPPPACSGAPAGPGTADAAARGHCEQVNLALGGDVFAVQRGNLTLHIPADHRWVGK
jgi:hypothetical protein